MDIESGSPGFDMYVFLFVLQETCIRLQGKVFGDRP
jgi:hypothetical protein